MKIKYLSYLTLIVVLAFPLMTHAADSARTLHDDAIRRQGTNADDILLSPLEGGEFSRKEPGIFFHRQSTLSATEQFAVGESEIQKGNLRNACDAFERVVRSFPFSPEAPKAQRVLAFTLEQRERYDRAFEEYHYLLHFYPEASVAGETLSRMLAIANYYAGREKDSTAVTYYTLLTSIAPAWTEAPRCYFSIGSIEYARKNYYEAAEAFDTITTSYPNSVFASAAADQHALTLYALSEKYKEDEAIQKRAIALTVAALKNKKERPEQSILMRNLNNLTERRDAKAFAIASFYDTKRFSSETTIAAYRNFLRLYPLASQAAIAQARIQTLEATLTVHP